MVTAQYDGTSSGMRGQRRCSRLLQTEFDDVAATVIRGIAPWVLVLPVELQCRPKPCGTTHFGRLARHCTAKHFA
jgi:hypothetical protein